MEQFIRILIEVLVMKGMEVPSILTFLETCTIASQRVPP